MSAVRILGLVLLIAGALAVAYGGFSYSRETANVKLGPVELSVKQQERVNVPLWAGIGAIVVGGALMLLGGKRG